MNAKQKLHQASLERWALLIQAQAESGLTVKAWCEENDVSFNAYNYWKHQLKEEYVESCMPDIVRVATGPALPDQSSQMASCDSRHSYEPQPIRICTADVDVSVSSMASDDLILRVLKAVRYA